VRPRSRRIDLVLALPSPPIASPRASSRRSRISLHSRQNTSALGWAATRGHLSTVNLLLRARADIHARGPNVRQRIAAQAVPARLPHWLAPTAQGHPPLLNAARAGASEVVAALLEKRANVNDATEASWRARAVARRGSRRGSDCRGASPPFTSPRAGATRTRPLCF
jgi:hypothetical protein